MRGKFGHDARSALRAVRAIEHEIVIVLAVLMLLPLLLLFVLLLPTAARATVAAVAGHAQCGVSLTVGVSRVLSRSRAGAGAARRRPACRSKARRGCLALALL